MFNYALHKSTSDDYLSQSTINTFSKPKQVVEKKLINLFLAGTGTVGRELLNQLQKFNHPTLKIQVVGSCNTRFTKWKVSPLTKQSYAGYIEETEATDWNKIIERLKSSGDNLIFVDCTGCGKIADFYDDLLNDGIHIVTPGKIANTKNQAFYEAITKTDKPAHYCYEGTVGAGLPVLSTIKQLRETGDEITKIVGVVSGTMTYIFECLENGVPFSKAVKSALEYGYSEPDPRDDLSGEDVARKFLILARESGLKIERTDFTAENQTPDTLKDCSVEEFLEGLSQYDDYWKEKIDHAKANGEVLRYSGKLDNGNISVGVNSFPKESPFGSLKGTDNQIVIYSDVYKNSPLIIQGPGAGKEVTAQVVLSDVIKIAHKIG